jgi:hypothetical protein
VSDAGAQQAIEIVPLNIAELDEATLLAMFPTPVQCAGALIIARERMARVPAALSALQKERDRVARRLVVAKGLAFQAGRKAGMSVSDANAWRDTDDDVQQAQADLDHAQLAYDYGRDRRRAIEKDIDVLRSLNANFRGEH